MLSSRPRSRRLAIAGALTSLLLVATACGGTGEKKPTDDKSVLSTFPTTVPSQPPYLDVPDGVELTPAGKGLSLGHKATVAWVPRQDEVGVVRLVVRKIEVSTVAELLPDFTLTEQQKQSIPYLVHVRVTNVGERALGGRALPLYLATTEGTLVESSEVDDQFAPCRPGVLPSEFPTGKGTNLCLLYLLPQKLSPLSVSFVPTVDVDPIYWQGAVDKYQKSSDKGGKNGKNGKGKKKGKGTKKQKDEKGES